jgi:phosphate transport system substrate-binding protein
MHVLQGGCTPTGKFSVVVAPRACARWTPLALIGLALGASACARSGGGDASRPFAAATPVRVDGSSTVYPVSAAVADEVAKDGVRATVRSSGTTAGFKTFCRGETDVSDASRPIDQSELDACRRAGVEFIELPIGYDGIALVVNADNDWVDYLTVAELRTMWAPEATGKITSWKQIRASFPDRPLHLVGPGGDSGTFDYFTQAVVGAPRASRTDYKGSEDDTVLVRDVIADPGALGYFGYAYYVRNRDRLRAVPIDDGNRDNGDGPIAPSPATVASGTYQPLSRPIFIYVNVASLRRPEVEHYVSFYLKVTRELSAEIGYVSLPLHVDQLARDRFAARRTGTMFGGGGPRIGVTMEKLLEAEEAAPSVAASTLRAP